MIDCKASSLVSVGKAHGIKSPPISRAYAMQLDIELHPTVEVRRRCKNSSSVLKARCGFVSMQIVISG